jgi:O-antigen/teichoic acid export membrane protein
MLGISLALGVVAPAVIPRVYGAAFAPATAALWVLLPGIVFLSLSKILTKYLYGIGRPGLCLWSTATSAAVTAVIIVPCVKTAGIVGAGVASSIAYAAGATVDLVFTRRLSGCRWSDFLLPRRADACALTEFQ